MGEATGDAEEGDDFAIQGKLRQQRQCGAGRAWGCCPQHSHVLLPPLPCRQARYTWQGEAVCPGTSWISLCGGHCRDCFQHLSRSALILQLNASLDGHRWTDAHALVRKTGRFPSLAGSGTPPWLPGPGCTLLVLSSVGHCRLNPWNSTLNCPARGPPLFPWTRHTHSLDTALLSPLLSSTSTGRTTLHPVQIPTTYSTTMKAKTSS